MRFSVYFLLSYYDTIIISFRKNMREGIMNKAVQENCELLAENRKRIKSVTFFEMDLIRLMGALAFTMAGECVDTGRYAEARKILRKNASFISTYRGIPEVLLISKMAMAKDPKAYYEAVDKVYTYMMRNKFLPSEDRVLASISIVDYVEEAKRLEAVDKGLELFKRLNKLHPFLVCEDDVTFSVLLALSDANAERILEDVEACYQNMKKESFFGRENVQKLTQILGVSGRNREEKCERVRALSKAFKEKHRNFGKGPEYPILGGLAIMDMPVDEIVSQVIEADNILRHKKGFGAFGTGKKMRQVFAAAMVILANLKVKGADTKAAAAAEGQFWKRSF